MRTRRRYIDDFEDRELARDPCHARLGGVCAGVARYFDVSRFFVRLIAVIALCLAPQVTLIAYGLAYLILDEHA
ncbi:MAG TPA: PspC domain-containing protein [Pseudomonadales bacterium]|nr:PspC domain-containing protein [Pseudomonadales bacterium]